MAEYWPSTQKPTLKATSQTCYYIRDFLEDWLVPFIFSVFPLFSSPPVFDTQFFILRWIPHKPSRAQKKDKKDIFLPAQFFSFCSIIKAHYLLKKIIYSLANCVYVFNTSTPITSRKKIPLTFYSHVVFFGGCSVLFPSFLFV